MKREDILARLKFTVPEIKKKRVIVHADIAAEADDQFAIVHHLLTPTEDVVGIIAANFEWKFRSHEGLLKYRNTSMEQSYQEGKRLLEAMNIEDVPLLKGAIHEIQDIESLPESEGADFIIQEAMKDSDLPLYIALQGGLTDLAIAFLREPHIAQRLTAIWIGGGKYPNGGKESNLQQDILAAQIIFQSSIPLWQIPINVYSGMHISFSEMMTRVQPCGEVGRYLMDGIFRVNNFYGSLPVSFEFPHGESWSIGDQPTVSVLLQNPGYICWDERTVTINDDMTYQANDQVRNIRVYNEIDRRLTLEDFYEKLSLCYKQK